MADKTFTAAYPDHPTPANISTAGSIAANALTVVFDEATSVDRVMDMLEVAKCDILAYYARRVS